ncbi:hypothetical protein CYFUS_004309 [Cystobacter fuscus]|uniref:Uncharacterized protein n=1 Tax=Cystobacter fuscus TaxID=43 RepID=A0A250J4I9_9BACT|nr:hypothetical protein CYFUS_004309 [Cystobacter fuscus]
MAAGAGLVAGAAGLAAGGTWGTAPNACVFWIEGATGAAGGARGATGAICGTWGTEGTAPKACVVVGAGASDPPAFVP